MKKCEVIKTVNLTVQPGSEVIVSDQQYEAAKGYLKGKGESLKQMSKTELIALAASKSIYVTEDMTKPQIIELLERQTAYGG